MQYAVSFSLGPRPEPESDRFVIHDIADIFSVTGTTEKLGNFISQVKDVGNQPGYVVVDTGAVKVCASMFEVRR